VMVLAKFGMNVFLGGQQRRSGRYPFPI
jgi:hypothetical protein